MRHESAPDRELRIPLAGDLLGEAREVVREALARISPADDPRLHYRALYAAERLGRVERSGPAGFFRLISLEELDVLADCARLLILDGPDGPLRRKAWRVVDMEFTARG